MIRWRHHDGSGVQSVAGLLSNFGSLSILWLVISTHVLTSIAGLHLGVDFLDAQAVACHIFHVILVHCLCLWGVHAQSRKEGHGGTKFLRNA